MIKVKIYYTVQEDGVKAWAYIRQTDKISSMPIGPSKYTHSAFETLQKRYTEFEWEDLEASNKPQNDITMRD